MVVDIALTAWLELHHEQGQVLRAKHMIHQHFQGNAKDATARDPSICNWLYGGICESLK